MDFSGETFAAKAGELRVDMVGVSTLLTTTMKNQKSVIEALEREGLRGRVKVMVGGRLSLREPPLHPPCPPVYTF